MDTAIEVCKINQLKCVNHTVSYQDGGQKSEKEQEKYDNSYGSYPCICHYRSCWNW